MTYGYRCAGKMNKRPFLELVAFIFNSFLSLVKGLLAYMFVIRIYCT
jgi:hypothetical protein